MHLSLPPLQNSTERISTPGLRFHQKPRTNKRYNQDWSFLLKSRTKQHWSEPASYQSCKSLGTWIPFTYKELRWALSSSRSPSKLWIVRKWVRWHADAGRKKAKTVLPNTNIFIHHCTYNVSDQQQQNLSCQKQIWSSNTLAAHGNCSDKSMKLHRLPVLCA
jgi:hypothetical protein